MTEQDSPGGSKLYRHDQGPTSDGRLPDDVDPRRREALEAALEAALGAEPSVFHEIISETVHVDLYIYPPTAERDWTTVVTMGLSDRPMTVPDELEERRFAEILFYLPPDWPLPEGSDSREEDWWPFRNAKFLARFPHEYNTWLGPGHTIPNGDPPTPYVPSTLLSTVLFLEPVLEEPPLSPIVSEGDPIHLLWMVPITTPECALKLEQGTDALLDVLDAEGFDRCIVPGRNCQVTGKAPRRLSAMPKEADGEAGEKKPWWKIW